MKLSDISIKRPVFTTMIMLALLVFGLIGFKNIGVDLFPKVEFPVITVVSVLPGANPETVETTVSEPIEDALSTISSIKHLRSTSSDSLSQVVIEFDLDKNFDAAYQEVQAKLNSIRSELPEDLEDPIIEKFDIDSAPIMSVVISGKVSAQEISKIADKVIKTRLQQVKDVGQIKILGKKERTIWLYLHPQKLEGYNISTGDVRDALENHHVEIPGGRITTDRSEIQVKTKAEFSDVAGLQNMIIAYRNGSPIRVRDVGRVEDGVEEERSRCRLNGEKACALLIRKQSGANTVAVASALKKEIQKLQKELTSSGMQIEIAQDLSVYIEHSIHEIQFHLFFGGLLAVLIVLLFLRNIRITLISALAIPISVIATFALMQMLGFTMNVMTMLALSLAIGILIDDAIVVVENIFRHFQEKDSSEEAARVGTAEIGLAAFAITMSIVAVFLPVAFMKGIIGRFFYQFGLTVTFAVLISLFVAFTLTPMLSAKFLRKNEHPGFFSRLIGSVLELLDHIYTHLLSISLKFRKTTLFVALALFVCSLFLFKCIRSEFTPMEDQSEFNIRIKAPLGTPLEKTDTYLSDIAEMLKKEPWVRYTFQTIGQDNGERVNEGSIYVKMVDKEKRSLSQFDAMKMAREKIAGFSSLKTSVEPVERVSGGGRKSSAIILDIKGPHLHKIEAIANELLAKLKNIDGYLDLDTSYEKGKPEIEVFIKREKAAALGVTPLTIAQTIQTLIGGSDVSKFKDEGDRYNISVRLDEPFRTKSENIYHLTVRGSRGELIPLKNLVDIQEAVGPVQIDRHNKSKIITLYANLQHGKKTLGDAVSEIQAFLYEMKLPPGYNFSFSGSADAMKDSFANLLFALGLAVIAVYMVLASQFESFIHPFTIMLSIPFSIIGCLLALAITGSTFSIFTLIGIIMLMGLVTKNAILLIDYTNTLRKRDKMSRYDALLKAGVARLHPILMTTFAMIFGMLPIALGTGSGSESRAPMAIAIIGGLITSMFLTLIIVPVVYTVLDDV